MKLNLRVKLLLYKFFSISLGRFILKLLSFGVKVDNLNGKKPKKHPFFVVVTNDTESGYVNHNERRVWQNEDPTAFIGYYYGIKNLVNILDKHKVKATFFLSTNCFSSTGKEYIKIKKELDNLINKGHEIGLHLHPDSDLAIQKKLSKKFSATSAFFYTYEEKLNIIKAAKEIIEKNLGKKAAKKLVSFRWGNWALDTDGAKAIDKLGFEIDSSATPGIKGHLKDQMKYDWSKVSSHYPWRLSAIDYQATNHKNLKITEIPIATFNFFGLILRADPVYSVMLNRAFIEYYRKADRSEKPFVFVVITHSCEATTKKGQPTTTLKNLDEFISFAKKHEVKFVTLRDACKLVTS